MRIMPFVTLVSLVAAPLTAQQRRTELSLGLVGVSLDLVASQSIFQAMVQSPTVAVGFYVSPTIAIEPAIGVAIQAARGNNASFLDFSIAVPFYSDSTWGHSGYFVAPFAGVKSRSIYGKSSSQYAVGLRMGGKLRVADQVSLKISGGVSNAFANSNYSADFALSAGLGLSVFF